MLHGLYGNPIAVERRFSWELLHKLKTLNSKPWLCGGNFNEIFSFSEKIRGNDCSSASLLNFRMALSDCGLGDLGFTGPMITWVNKRGSEIYFQERLDRCTCDDRWCGCFPQAIVEYLDFSKSDHLPILIRLEEVISKTGSGKHKPFRFEPLWLKEEKECRDLVESKWCICGLLGRNDAFMWH